LVLLAMAAGQLSDLPGFVEALRDYDLAHVQLAWVVAVSLVVGEATGGALLLTGSNSARASGAVVAVGVAIAWFALALTAFARGEGVQNCGCFGVYLAQPLRWWILVEDVEFVALAVWVLLGTRRSTSQGSDPSRTGFHTTTVEGAPDVRAPQA
jgi:hypothetical protein